MTPTDLSLPGLLAMAAPPAQATSPWVQLLPFALVIGIFYFLILLPMKRRQKKVDEFLRALKAGDRVVTTGGIVGTITRVSEEGIKLEIAPSVRIDVVRTAIVGYQGQPPVADQSA